MKIKGLIKKAIKLTAGIVVISGLTLVLVLSGGCKNKGGKGEIFLKYCSDTEENSDDFYKISRDGIGTNITENMKIQEINKDEYQKMLVLYHNRKPEELKNERARYFFMQYIKEEGAIRVVVGSRIHEDVKYLLKISQRGIESTYGPFVEITKSEYKDKEQEIEHLSILKRIGLAQLQFFHHKNRYALNLDELYPMYISESEIMGKFKDYKVNSNARNGYSEDVLVYTYYDDKAAVGFTDGSAKIMSKGEFEGKINRSEGK